MPLERYDGEGFSGNVRVERYDGENWNPARVERFDGEDWKAVTIPDRNNLLGYFDPRHADETEGEVESWGDTEGNLTAFTPFNDPPTIFDSDVLGQPVIEVREDHPIHGPKSDEHPYISNESEGSAYFVVNYVSDSGDGYIFATLDDNTEENHPFGFRTDNIGLLLGDDPGTNTPPSGQWGIVATRFDKSEDDAEAYIFGEKEPVSTGTATLKDLDIILGGRWDDEDMTSVSWTDTHRYGPILFYDTMHDADTFDAVIDWLTAEYGPF